MCPSVLCKLHLGTMKIGKRYIQLALVCRRRFERIPSIGGELRSAYKDAHVHLHDVRTHIYIYIYIHRKFRSNERLGLISVCCLCAGSNHHLLRDGCWHHRSHHYHCSLPHGHLLSGVHQVSLNHREPPLLPCFRFT